MPAGPIDSPAIGIGESNKHFTISSQYFQTTGLFDIDGNERTFGDTENFTEWDLDAELTFGLNDKFDFGFGGKYRRITSQQNGGQKISDAGPESGYGFIRYFVNYSPALKLSLEGKFKGTFYTDDPENTNSGVDLTADALAIGNGNNEITVTGHATYKWSATTWINGSLGYTKPDDHQSQYIPYKVELALLGASWGLGVGARGMYGLDTDDFSSSPSSVPITGYQNTNRYNSINPSYNEGFARLNYLWSKQTLIWGTVAQVVSGTNWDSGRSVSVGLTYRSIGGKSPKQKVLSQFKEYTYEANIVKVSANKGFFQIDRGLDYDLKVGDRVDVYRTNFKGKEELLVIGVIVRIKTNTAFVSTRQKLSNKNVQKGDIARLKID